MDYSLALLLVHDFLARGSSMLLFGISLFLVNNFLFVDHDLLFSRLRLLLFRLYLRFLLLGSRATPIFSFGYLSVHIDIEDVCDHFTDDLSIAEKVLVNLISSRFFHRDEDASVGDGGQRENELSNMIAKQILDEEHVRVTRVINDIPFAVDAICARALLGHRLEHLPNTAEVEVVTPQVSKVVHNELDVLKFAPKSEVNKAGKFVPDAVI